MGTRQRIRSRQLGNRAGAWLLGPATLALLLLAGSAVAQEPEGTAVGTAEGTGEGAPVAEPAGTGEGTGASIETGTPAVGMPSGEIEDTAGTVHEMLEEAEVLPEDEPDQVPDDIEAAAAPTDDLVAEAAVAADRPTDVVVMDAPNDSGEQLAVAWTAPATMPDGYRILAATAEDGDFEIVAEAGPVATSAVFGVDNDVDTWVRVYAVYGATENGSEAAGPASASPQWFDGDKMWVAILGFLICAFVIIFIETARRGRELFIRKIAGLEAIDEAIGRSTEMGRPILFVPGIMDMDNVQTLAGLTILGHVSKMVAEYETEIDVPVSRSLVMTAGREVIQQAFLEAGRPDAYNDNMVHFLTDEQFGYVAGVNGIIVRDEPACCFYQGAFYAESLILAETGNSMGAIQIAGTAMPSQLPFFVAACDYTLIGEELFAASAYLSNDPQQLGSLKGQDVGKLIAMVAIALGALGATVVSLAGPESAIGEAVSPVLEWLRNVFGAS